MSLRVVTHLWNSLAPSAREDSLVLNQHSWLPGSAGEKSEVTDNEFQRIVKSLQLAPETIRELVSGLPDKSLTWKPSGTEFSILEHICHLRDIEKEGYAVRIEKLLTEVEPLLRDIDGNRLADERVYNRQNLRTALLEFTLARENNVRVLQCLTLDQLSRNGIFEKVGSVSLEGLMIMMSEHDQEHLKELTDLRGRLDIDQ